MGDDSEYKFGEDTNVQSINHRITFIGYIYYSLRRGYSVLLVLLTYLNGYKYKEDII